jgi:hypothetical protein
VSDNELPELPVRSGFGFWKRLRLSLLSGWRYGWRQRTVRGGVMQFRGEMFRLQTDYFPGLN